MLSSFNKSPKIEAISLLKNESIHCKSKFYLSTDLDNNLIDKQNLDQLKLQKSRLKIIEFLSFNGHIFCDECNSKLRNQIYLNEKNLNKFNESNNLIINEHNSSIGYSICSLHNPPIYQDSIDIIQKKTNINQQENDRQLLEESIVRLFIKCNLMNGELQRLHLLVERLINSNNDLFDYFSRIILNKGLHQLKLKILDNQLGEILQEEQLIKVLIKIWKNFYTQILPIIECSFYNLKDQHLSIKQVTLKAFRDEIVLKLKKNLEVALMENIKKRIKVPYEIKQMLLILNAIDLKVPTKQQLELEKLCSICVPIFIGYKGLYVENKLVVKSNEPLINKKSLELNIRRPHSDCNQIIEGYS